MNSTTTKILNLFKDTLVIKLKNGLKRDIYCSVRVFSGDGVIDYVFKDAGFNMVNAEYNMKSNVVQVYINRICLKGIQLDTYKSIVDWLEKIKESTVKNIVINDVDPKFYHVDVRWKCDASLLAMLPVIKEYLDSPEGLAEII